MPRLSTSRIFPIPSVRFLPGMKAPTGANTPFMSVRALGAPHTTWTGLPSPVSTMHTRSRSALGCGLASTTRAMTNGANSFALSSMRSTSSPIMVSLAAISSSERAVSRCSPSQAKVSFIMGFLLPRHSRAQPSSQRRPIERAEAVVRQPAQIGFEEGAQIGHAVFEHRDAVDAHAAGENFHPILAFAEADLALVAAVLDVDFERRLGEREE